MGLIDASSHSYVNTWCISFQWNESTKQTWWERYYRTSFIHHTQTICLNHGCFWSHWRDFDLFLFFSLFFFVWFGLWRWWIITNILLPVTRIPISFQTGQKKKIRLEIFCKFSFEFNPNKVFVNGLQLSFDGIKFWQFILIFLSFTLTKIT